MKKLFSLIKDRWFQEDVLGRLFGNAGKLLAGVVASSLLGLASNILTARRLSPGPYGFLVLLSTYMFFIVYGLVSFQSWQALIHYGAQALVNRNQENFKSLIKFGFILDGASSFIGAALGAGCVYAYGHWKDWNPSLIHIAVLYSLGILLHVTGTASAVLRLFNRFDRLALHQTTAAGVRLLGILIVYIRRAGLAGFLYVWLATEIVGYLILLTLGWIELRRRGVTGVFQSPLRGITKKFPGIWKFFLITNLHATLRTGVKELDIIAVGGILGASAAGIYKIARQFARAIGRLDEIMRQAIYPELSKNWARRDARRFRKLLWKPAVIIGSAGVALWLFFLFLGKPVIRLTVGSIYVDSYFPILVYLAGVVISMATFHFQSTLLAMGRPAEIFRVTVWSTFIYLFILFWLTKKLNIMGAAFAFVGYQMLWSAWMGIRIKKRLSCFQDSQPMPKDAAAEEIYLE